MAKFSDLNLNTKILKAIDEAGYETPTPIQADAIPAALEGKDVLGIAQTGTGKTASFTLPMIHFLARGRARALRARRRRSRARPCASYPVPKDRGNSVETQSSQAKLTCPRLRWPGGQTQLEHPCRVSPCVIDCQPSPGKPYLRLTHIPLHSPQCSEVLSKLWVLWLNHKT